MFFFAPDSIGLYWLQVGLIGAYLSSASRIREDDGGAFRVSKKRLYFYSVFFYAKGKKNTRESEMRSESARNARQTAPVDVEKVSQGAVETQ